MIVKYNMFNESIRQYLKPKSEEEIERHIKSLNISVLNRFYMALKYGVFNIIKDIINNNPNIISTNNNIAIRTASEYGYYDIVKYLLYEIDKRKGNYDAIFKVDNVFTMSSIDKAYNNKHYNIVELLLKHPKCKDYLSDKIINIYKEHIEDYKKQKEYLKQLGLKNESIKHLLKPKNEDDIINSLEKLKPNEKIRTIFKYGLRHLISDDELKELLNNTNDGEILDIIIDNNLLNLVNNDTIGKLLNKHKSPLDILIKYPDLLEYLEDDYFLKDQLSYYNIEILISILYQYPHIKSLFSNKEIEEIEHMFKDYVYNYTDVNDMLAYIDEYDLLKFFTEKEIRELEKEL